jgi:hypothetical protein
MLLGGLIGDLAGETMAGYRLTWPDICRRWLPVWLPNLVSAANVRQPCWPTDGGAATLLASRPHCRPGRRVRMDFSPPDPGPARWRNRSAGNRLHQPLGDAGNPLRRDRGSRGACSRGRAWPASRRAPACGCRDSRGSLRWLARAGAQDPACPLDDAALIADRRGQEQRVQGRAVKALPDIRPGRDYRQRRAARLRMEARQRGSTRRWP